MQKKFQIFGVFPEKHYLCICKLIQDMVKSDL